MCLPVYSSLMVKTEGMAREARTAARSAAPNKTVVRQSFLTSTELL